MSSPTEALAREIAEALNYADIYIGNAVGYPSDEKTATSIIAAKIAPLMEDAARYRFIRDHKAKMNSPKMNSEHGWCFGGGWPALIGPSFDVAVDRAIVDVEKEIART